MSKPMVCDIWTQGEFMVGFVGMHIIVSQECEGANIFDDMWNALFISRLHYNPRN
jgi:hypothetical protein